MKKKRRATRATKRKTRGAVQLVAYKARVHVIYARTRDITVHVEGWDRDSMQGALAEVIGERLARNVFETLRGPT